MMDLLPPLDAVKDFLMFAGIFAAIFFAAGRR
jgi:hypothetical protein